MRATDKQINYALHLLSKAGYSTRWMNAQFKELGVKCADRRGTVEDYLRGLQSVEISKLIDRLKAQ